jgi:hypothetical protein
VAVTVTVLAGITGSASGGMSIALAAMSDTFIAAANAAHIPLEVLHRIAAMASGGMDTLPHNGAVITLLAVTGLTHRQAYKDVFVIAMTKTAAVFFVIAFFLPHGSLLIRPSAWNLTRPARVRAHLADAEHSPVRKWDTRARSYRLFFGLWSVNFARGR